jgi:hypothetical protein
MLRVVKHEAAECGEGFKAEKRDGKTKDTTKTDKLY